MLRITRAPTAAQPRRKMGPNPKPNRKQNPRPSHRIPSQTRTVPQVPAPLPLLRHHPTASRPTEKKYWLPLADARGSVTACLLGFLAVACVAFPLQAESVHGLQRQVEVIR